MAETYVVRTNSDRALLNEEDLADLKSRVRGEIILPSDGSKYDESRKVWNAMIDKRPGVIVSCAGAGDVIQCVNYARERSLKVVVRGGGHSIAGKSLLDDALLIDLSQLRLVRVDVVTKTANVSPGALLGDIDHETKQFGLALPMGVNSTTGISGLTLGGGFGWLSRKYGMTIDSLLSADVVTAEGQLVRCDKSNHPDLFWAIRGGGGNFGIVTNFEFQLYELGPMVTAGPIVYPLEDGVEVLKGINERQKTNPDELMVWGCIRQAPPFPFVPEEFHFKPVILVVPCFIGKEEEADALIAPYMKLGNMLGHGVGPVPLFQWNQAFDPLLTPGVRNYWKTCQFSDITDGMIDVILKFGANLVNFGTEIFLAGIGGAVNRVPSGETAYPHRQDDYILNCHMRWESPDDDDANRTYARNLAAALEPFASGAEYSNFVVEEGGKTDAIYGANIDKLGLIKAKYDPDNFFSHNYNILPKA